MAEKVEFDEEICKVLLDKFQDELASNLKEYYTWNFEPALNKLDESTQKEIRVKIEQLDPMPVDLIPCKTIALKQKMKDVMLKDIISQNEIENEDSWNLYSKFVKWVVKDWGRIRIDVSKNKDKFCELWKKIKTNQKRDDYTDILGFDNISSLSKVASFLDEKKYAVYDSRVAFSLNWLIFINGLHCKDEKYGKMKFFHQPGEGQERNSDMKEHRQLPFFKRKYGKESENNKLFFKSFYYERMETYQRYCELLNKTVKYYKDHKSDYQIGKDQITIGELEMCLFSIAADARNISKENIYKKNIKVIENDNRKIFIANEMDLYPQIERI